MATQSRATQALAAINSRITRQSPVVMEPANSAQLESSINDQTKALILDVTYDAPALKDVAEFRAAFETAEKGAHAAAKKMFRNLVKLIKYCAMVRSYLSERGVNAELRKQAGIPAGFERWYEGFRSQHDIAWAYKTMLHKIAELEGGCEKCGRLTSCDSDHKKSCVLYRPLIEQAEPGEKRGGPTIDIKVARTAFYADRYTAIVALLTNAPKDATPEQLIATMQEEAEKAHQDMDAETAKKIKVPRLVKPDPSANKKVLEEQQRHILELEEQIARIKKESEAAKQRVVENFRQRLEAVSEIPEHLRDDKITGELAAEPDQGEAGSRLTAYLATVINRVLPPHMALHLVNASVRYAGRDRRIMVGDFLQKDDRGTKVKTLAKCTAIADYEQRRRVREWNDGKWGKEHVVFSNDESGYTVITEAAASLLAPGAFQ